MLSLGYDNLDESLLMAQKLLKKKQALEKKKKSSSTKKSVKPDLLSGTSRHKPSSASSSHSHKTDPMGESSHHNGIPSASQSSRKSLRKSSAHSKTSVDDEVSMSSVLSRDSATSSLQLERTPSTKTTVTENVVFKDMMAVDRTWEQIKISVPEYEEILGEQVVLKMMELDPQARQDMKIVSLRSQRFEHIQKTLLVMIDLVIVLIGPDVEEFEQELQGLGRQCQDEGISVSLLGKAVSEAVRYTMLTANLEMSAEDFASWKVVWGFCAEKMAAVVSN